jgi:flagellar hook assembly protein FlgD
VSTTPIGQTTSTPDPTATSAAVKKDTMGKDAFMNLLVTQLEHQDPTQPQDNSEFVAQLAQFSSLEQLTQIQQTLQSIATALGVNADGSVVNPYSTGATTGGTTTPGTPVTA